MCLAARIVYKCQYQSNQSAFTSLPSSTIIWENILGSEWLGYLHAQCAFKWFIIVLNNLCESNRCAGGGWCWCCCVSVPCICVSSRHNINLYYARMCSSGCVPQWWCIHSHRSRDCPPALLPPPLSLSLVIISDHSTLSTFICHQHQDNANLLLIEYEFESSRVHGLGRAKHTSLPSTLSAWWNTESLVQRYRHARP